MKTIRATIENGELLLQEPLPDVKGSHPAILVIAGEEQDSLPLPPQKLRSAQFTAEEEFEAIGLRDFFGEPVDEGVRWEKFFQAGGERS